MLLRLPRNGQENFQPPPPGRVGGISGTPIFYCFIFYLKSATELQTLAESMCLQEFSLQAVGVDEFTQNKLRDDHSAYQGWMNYLKDGSRKLGREIDVTPKLKGWLLEAGFVDVAEKRIMAP